VTAVADAGETVSDAGATMLSDAGTTTVNDAGAGESDAGSTPEDAGCGTGHCIDTQCSPAGINGAVNGFEVCANGAIHKTGPAICSPTAGTPPQLCAPVFIPDAGACLTDSECEAGTVCVGAFPGNEGEGEGYPPCACGKRGCTSDDDCGPSGVCDCFEGSGFVNTGTCVDASCRGPADCASGVCAVWHPNDSCGPLFALVACMSSTDSCNGSCSDSECAPSADGGCANPDGPRSPNACN
jgi:hypothetical protein